jgi:peroxiredoxin
MAFTVPLGGIAPDFSLPGTDGKTHSLADFRGAKLLVIAFSCNHCPYVIGSEDRMIKLAADYAPRGVAFVAINSNETDNHPLDSFEHMKQRAAEKRFSFPYLRDEDQSVARAYGALRTPHFYLFDADHKLRYTGRMDNHPKDATLATTYELRDAIEALLVGKKPPVEVTNPIGCNVKWKGKPEKWMPPEACDLV